MFVFEERPSDARLVETVWRTRSGNDLPGHFTSVAASQWELTLTRQQGRTRLHLRGPETHASRAAIPPDAEFLGLRFRLGSFMPHLPTPERVDGGLELPAASARAFWLQGSAWPHPDFDDADVFVARLVRAGLLTREPIVEQLLRGEAPELSPRTLQRRFVQATGVSASVVRRIEQANRARALLEAGHSIPDTVFLAGYADQPHLTRALKQLTGQTPGQLRASGGTEQTPPA